MPDTPDVVPYPSHAGPNAAIAFLSTAFGLTVVQVHGSDGAVQHAELSSGTGVARLWAADAEVVRPPEDAERGARRWRARDAGGHERSFDMDLPNTEPPTWV